MQLVQVVAHTRDMERATSFYRGGLGLEPDFAAGVEVTEIREPVAGLKVFDALDPDGNRFSIESRAPG